MAESTAISIDNRQAGEAVRPRQSLEHAGHPESHHSGDGCGPVGERLGRPRALSCFLDSIQGIDLPPKGNPMATTVNELAA